MHSSQRAPGTPDSGATRATRTTRHAPARKPLRLNAVPALAALALLTVPQLALAQSPGYYVGLHAGANDLKHWPASVGFGAGVKAQGRLTLDHGANIGLAVGRRTENARFEFEYQRGRFQLRGTDLGSVGSSASGAGHYETFLFNADRVLPVNGALAAYVGGGLGWGSVSFPSAGSAGGCNCFGSASGNGLAYQGRVGLEYTLGNGPNLYLQAGWISLPGGSSGGTPGVEYPRRGTATLDAGVRLRF